MPWYALHPAQVHTAILTRIFLLQLEPFQELPQLLDPHLGRLLPVLADALLDYLRSLSTSSALPPTYLLLTLSTAVCRLLYTFCKIRGEKIVVRFFSAEVKNLELLLSAIETNENTNGPVVSNDARPTIQWTWEERYICLLWLSHLLLAPFDLATISSADSVDTVKPDIEGLAWPDQLPGVALRVIPLAMKYLSSAGKERDSAKVLLVRLSMRRDMQELGLLHALVQWALSCLSSSNANTSPYHYIGILSYVAGILVSSASTADMDPYLMRVFQAVQTTDSHETTVLTSIKSYALARKTVIKVLRALAVILLRGSTSLNPQRAMESTDIVEGTIGHLLEALADSETPVRLAASKSLSVVTLKLPSDMAAQVVDAVLDSLTYNVLWEDKPVGSKSVRIRDLSAVNELEWHGLILTLSHLLYRRSPPPESLPAILHALLIALSFEKRSTSGNSVGSNVRDAACFGIWALARQYTTAELQKVDMSSLLAAKHHDASSSVLQVLATELVLSASLDPAGNIRRGASAALQELIGRHPDTIAEAIPIVQVVDYHAVALRSKALTEVAPGAAALSAYYKYALLDALLSWRGVGDGDASSRRQAATGVGHLVAVFQAQSTDPWGVTSTILDRIDQQLKGLKQREVDERHGLLLSLAAVVSSLTQYLNNKSYIHSTSAESKAMKSVVSKLLRLVETILQDIKSSSYRRPDLIAEGTSRVISALRPVLVQDAIFRALAASPAVQEPAAIKELLKAGQVGEFDDEPASSTNLMRIAHQAGYDACPSILKLGFELLATWIHRTDKDSIVAVTQALSDLTFVADDALRTSKIEEWAQLISHNNSGRSGSTSGYLLVLAAIFEVARPSQQETICRTILHQWRVAPDIESRVAVLECLRQGSVLRSHDSVFIDMIAEGLDDYTSDTRGDIGSLVRIEAIKATGQVFDYIPWSDIPSSTRDPDVTSSWVRDIHRFSKVFGKVLRLSSEKLDKVRLEAQKSVAKVYQDKSEVGRFLGFSVSSYDYFRWLLEAQILDRLQLSLFNYQPDHWAADMLQGFVSSADTGSAGLVRVSRAALVDFCESSFDVEQKGGAHKQRHSAQLIWQKLYEIAKSNINNDRILVPTMELLGFLLDVGVTPETDFK